MLLMIRFLSLLLYNVIIEYARFLISHYTDTVMIMTLAVIITIRVVEQSRILDPRSHFFFIFHALIPVGGATILEFWIPSFSGIPDPASFSL